jgi:hypothetical protein
VIPLGRRTYLAGSNNPQPKGKGDNSMFGKAGHDGARSVARLVEARMAW